MMSASEATTASAVMPTCTLSWVKIEAGVRTEGDQCFWRPVSECLGMIRKIVSEHRKVGGEWVFTLKDAEGNEVPFRVDETQLADEYR